MPDEPDDDRWRPGMDRGEVEDEEDMASPDPSGAPPVASSNDPGGESG